MFSPRLYLFFAISAVCSFILVACASLNEGQCREGDWTGIGFHDGTKGATQARLADHQKACADYGIVPDAKAWDAGRRQGLKVYCTPKNAYRVGARGDSLSSACTTSELASMREAHDFGWQFYLLKSQKNDVDRDTYELEDKLRELPDDDEPETRIERRELESDLRRRRERAQELEWEMRRYQSWPG